MQFCDLSEILKFNNRHVLDRYCKDFNATQDEACVVFDDMLKFLWLTKKNLIEKEIHSSLNAFIVMHHEMIAIDNMWHTFILFTKDYTDFCQKYFGHYLHHHPTTEDDPIPTQEEFEREFATFLSYVYDNLGETTLRRWFADYC